MTFSERVLDALGPAITERAGDLLAPLVEGLTSELEKTDTLLQPATPERPWPAVFDLEHTPQPAWLGTATGTKVPKNLTSEQARDYVRDRAAWRRGTVDAMAAAVRALLDGTRSVRFIERDGTPGRIKIVVRADEAAGTNPAAILAAADTQRPIGLILTGVVTAPTLTYGDLADEHADYTDLGQDLTDYATASAGDLGPIGWWRPADQITRHMRAAALAPTYAAATTRFATYADARDHKMED